MRPLIFYYGDKSPMPANSDFLQQTKVGEGRLIGLDKRITGRLLQSSSPVALKRPHEYYELFDYFEILSEFMDLE